MKQLIKKLLNKAGWEISRTTNMSRSTMDKAFEWLSKHGFKVDSVLDVGASNGCWSRECMQFFPEARYTLFEPQTIHNDELDEFTNLNNNVRVVKKAVGSLEGYTYFDISTPLGGGLLKSSTDNSVKVEMTTIDTAVSEQNEGSSYLLKLDTHGFEKGILEGAEKTLKKSEILIIEAYNYQITDEALLFWELCAFLAKRGFRPIHMVDNMQRPYDLSLWQMDIVFIKDTWEGFNYTHYE
jgi:FkbM family methyltransferase